ncbi:hypothetical protein [Amycolatopsis benzoatilytica]|uniref:hypothetical protein n=1 Tax=Amycolatopsis benzoatilytica TaxID=346045 RepID=UPI000370E58C|nr:hypothetical protein [Amycolatopsis benzoatilytica]
MNSRRLTDFEQRLLAELKEVAAQPEKAVVFRDVRRPARTKLILAAAAAGLALAAGLTMVHGEPAYAVEAGTDGMVTVTVHRLDDAEGLEQQLRAHGVPAKVVYVPAGKYCEAPWYTTAPAEPPIAVEATDTATLFRLRPASLPKGETLVVQNATVLSTDAASSASLIAVGVAVGPVPPCRLADVPRPSGPPPDGSGFTAVKHP